MIRDDILESLASAQVETELVSWISKGDRGNRHSKIYALIGLHCFKGQTELPIHEDANNDQHECNGHRGILGGDASIGRTKNKAVVILRLR